ncbi:hypothetical protein GCM10009557_47270 [Virgisporangium ochraceum]|uniref:Uncharacterized protein n=1 Tax=Virgisporangium ochraceum TaxID=65505 RepID=A0A8J4A600_9ACTN|nr:hypothetical protein [Virgisporangium ochraceum]GIJ75157.1 hypothetical protein Voc01_100740 [Virgisporangium ochraceum]
MTLINHHLASPFLSPRSGGAAREEPPMPFDDSEDGRRRLRDPFAVDSTAVARATTERITTDGEAS